MVNSFKCEVVVIASSSRIQLLPRGPVSPNGDQIFSREDKGYPVEIDEHLADQDTQNAACHFFNGILNSAMPVHCQKLGEFKQNGTAQHDQAHKSDAPRISQAEEHADNSEGRQMFKAG